MEHSSIYYVSLGVLIFAALATLYMKILNIHQKVGTLGVVSRHQNILHSMQV